MARQNLIAIAMLACALGGFSKTKAEGPYPFGRSSLAGTGALNRPTSLQFGPDDRLYVGTQAGLIKIFDVVRYGFNDYDATGSETIDLASFLPNHDDDGTPNPHVERLLTGLLVTGTAVNPIIYATSSDWRIATGSDSGLDTNSGTVSRLTWNGATWDHVTLVRGLPRSEENHGPNGMALDTATNTLFVAQGGNTNMGAPSNAFAYLPEYALSAAILSVDLDAIGDTTYDIPTLDDPSRPNSGPNGTDEFDPFGGNDGDNQAMIVPGGPVQVYAPGFRNPYDVLLTTSGRMYTVDNGANFGWGGPPIGDGPRGICTNASSEDGSATIPDGLHLVDGSGYYGGHPCPVRANQANVFNGQSPVPFANPLKCELLTPGGGDPSLTWWSTSVNGLTEYRAGNFDGALVGALLVAAWSTNSINLVRLDEDGDQALVVSPIFQSVGNHPLDVTAPAPGSVYFGTVWVADHISGIIVYEPTDGLKCFGTNDAGLDEDGDGYDNADEIDSGTNPCSSASIPPDHDGDFVSDWNDPDDDDDGWPDSIDPFAIDPLDGLGTGLPVLYGWALGEPGFGLLGLGFTGHMTNDVDAWHDLFDPTNLTPGGAAGKLTVDSVSAGSARGASNDQENAFQLGVNVSAATGPFSAWTAVDAPFFNGQPAQPGQSFGLFIGSGTQDDYIAITLGDGGVEIVHESAGEPTATTYSADVTTAERVDLSLSIDPVAGIVQPRYAIDDGGYRVAGPSLTLDGALLDAVRHEPALAVGLLSTNGGAAPYGATWDGIEVFADGGDAAAEVRIDPPGSTINASTFDTGSFRITNLSPTQRVTSLTLDLSSSILPDVVFDPDGEAGDTTAKDFTVDSGGETVGVGTHALLDPHDGGFDRLEIPFTDFDPGETFTFSIDVDPTSIQGASAPGPEQSGSVSGLELSGAQITVMFDDGSLHVADMFIEPGTVDASATVASRTAATSVPTLTVLGEPIVPTIVTDADQTLRVTGPPGADVRLLQLESALSLAGVPGGGFDIAPFDTNRVVRVTEIAAVIGPNATVDVPVTLTDTDPEGRTNSFMALIDVPGGGGCVSNAVVLELSNAVIVAMPPFIDFGEIEEGSEALATVTIAIGAAENIIISNIELTGSNTISFNTLPTTPFALNEVVRSREVELLFAPTVAGDVIGTLLVHHDAPGSPLVVDLAGTGIPGVEPPPVIVVYRVNAGGPMVVPIDGSAPWEEDQLGGSANTGGTAENGTPSPFAPDATTSTYGTATPISFDESVPPDTPMQIFQTERWDPQSSPEMTWYFPVLDNTDYIVRLYFAEIYFSDPGDRIFDVRIDGQIPFPSIDSIQATGASHTGLMRSVAVTAQGDELSIEFIHIEENPSVKAIEILRDPSDCPTDFDSDGETGLTDLIDILVAWGSSGVVQDVDTDGIVGFGDLLAVLGAWGSCSQ